MKNKMRHEEFLQNYTPAWYRLSLCGKAEDKAWHNSALDTKEGWLKIFNDCLEDLDAGNFINGKGLKNDPDYWRKQIRELNEFTPFDKDAFDRDMYKHIHLKVPKHKKKLIEYLEGIPNKNGYIIDLIEKDMGSK